MICKGDRVFRIKGTAVGFRRYGHCDVVEASKSHIKVKNGEGLISKWFPIGDFSILNYNHKEVRINALIYEIPDERFHWRNQYKTEMFETAAGLSLRQQELEAAGFKVVGKKVLTIPFGQQQQEAAF